MMKIGILPLARPTFDVEFARIKLEQMLAILHDCPIKNVGDVNLLLNDQDIANAAEKILQQSLDTLIILQTTFTDAAAISKIAKQTDVKIIIWAVQEERSGGRLRLNSFCGLNLAAHALGLQHRKFQYIYSDPENLTPAQVEKVLDNYGQKKEIKLVTAIENEEGRIAANSINNAIIGQLGNHPAGFDTCKYDTKKLKNIFGVDVKQIPLDNLFSRAKSLMSIGQNKIETPMLNGIEAVDDEALAQSLYLTPGLKELAHEYGLNAISIRCWPECFTEYGGAVCGPVSMLAEEMLPCACESDVYGALSQLILQRIANAPVFLADLVDIDIVDNTAVLWHCGQAPLSMCDPEFKPKATIHSNRRLPLLYEFPLKPGEITLARISKSFNQHKMVIATGEMIRRPLAFSGTAGVFKFNGAGDKFVSNIIDSGLEHHFVVAYGDYRSQLHGVASTLNLPVFEF